MVYGVARLRYVFSALFLGSLAGGVFAEGSSRLGILFSAGVIIFASLVVLCQVVAQDLKALANRKDAPGAEKRSNAEPIAAADGGAR